MFIDILKHMQPFQDTLVVILATIFQDGRHKLINFIIFLLVFHNL